MKRLIVLLAACGGSTEKPATIDAPDMAMIDAAIDAPTQAFALTSPGFAQGATIPVVYTCNGGAAGNVSPQLVWPAGPSGTMSYAVILTDKANNLIHWVIYDIPGSATGLPQNVQKVYLPANVAGAKQTTSYPMTNPPRGYLGPCPNSLHTYEFVVYALDAATLPGAMMATDRAGAKTIIEMHDLAMAALSGMYGP